VGSDGVLIEVPADVSRYGEAYRVTVTGRVVDPQQMDDYEDVLETYKERFGTRVGRQVRLVQGDWVPGAYKIQNLIFLALLMVGFILNIRLWVKESRTLFFSGGKSAAQIGSKQQVYSGPSF
jgi:hypothetical protein